MFPFQEDVQASGVPGLDLVPLADGVQPLRALLVHAGCSTLILVAGWVVREGWRASEGRPPPPATPGSTPPAGAPGAHSGQPGDRPLGVRWPLPNGEDGPLGTSLPGPRASLQLRPPLLSLCSLLVTPLRELKPAGRRRGPWLTRPRVRSRLGLLTTQRNSWKPHTLCLC